MNADNPNSPDPRPSAPAVGKFKRYDMKKLLADPELRRKLIVQGTIATQAREGIDVTEAEAEDSYYVVTQAERAAFLGLVPFRSEAGENDGRHLEFVHALGAHTKSSTRHDIFLKDFLAIGDSPIAYDRLALVGMIFRSEPMLEPAYANAAQGLVTANDPLYVRCWWEVTSTKVSHKSRWLPFAKGGSYSRFYSDVYLVVNWSPEAISEMESNGRVQNTGFYFKAGLTWPLRTAKGLSVRRLPSGCVFGHKGPGIFPKTNVSEDFLLGVLNSRLPEFMAKTLTSLSWEVGVLKKVPIPKASRAATEIVESCAIALHDTKAEWDTGNEICTRFSRPWVLQPECADGAKTLSAALDQVLRHEAFLDAQLTETYARLNDEVYRL